MYLKASSRALSTPKLKLFLGQAINLIIVVSATAASTNLMLHLIKTTHAGDKTPKDVGDVAWGLPALPLPLPLLTRPAKTKNSQAMAGSIHAPLVRIELCYFCPPSSLSECLVFCPRSSVLCLLAGVF